MVTELVIDKTGHIQVIEHTLNAVTSLLLARLLLLAARILLLLGASAGSRLLLDLLLTARVLLLLGAGATRLLGHLHLLTTGVLLLLSTSALWLLNVSNLKQIVYKTFKTYLLGLGTARVTTITCIATVLALSTENDLILK